MPPLPVMSRFRFVFEFDSGGGDCSGEDRSSMGSGGDRERAGLEFESRTGRLRNGNSGSGRGRSRGQSSRQVAKRGSAELDFRKRGRDTGGRCSGRRLGRKSGLSWFGRSCSWCCWQVLWGPWFLGLLGLLLLRY